MKQTDHSWMCQRVAELASPATLEYHTVVLAGYLFDHHLFPTTYPFETRVSTLKL